MLNSFKRSVRACRRADLHRHCNMASLTHSILLGVSAESGSPYGLLSFTDPSWCHFDTYNRTVFWLGALRLRNCCQKSRCVVITDSLLIIPCRNVCYTDQCSMSTELQISLYIMTVNMEAALRGYPGFQIAKTVRCFWCTLHMKKKNLSLQSNINYCFMWTQYNSFLLKISTPLLTQTQWTHTANIHNNSRNQQILMSCNKDFN